MVDKQLSSKTSLFWYNLESNQYDPTVIMFVSNTVKEFWHKPISVFTLIGKCHHTTLWNKNAVLAVYNNRRGWSLAGHFRSCPKRPKQTRAV